jgi:uncharacterized protein YbjQ (UPF0145 family)
MTDERPRVRTRRAAVLAVALFGLALAEIGTAVGAAIAARITFATAVDDFIVTTGAMGLAFPARELALARMQAEAAQARASGIVGVTVEVKNHVWGEHATEFLATGTSVRRLADEHKLPETSPRPTFTLGLDS